MYKLQRTSAIGRHKYCATSIEQRKREQHQFWTYVRKKQNSADSESPCVDATSTVDRDPRETRRRDGTWLAATSRGWCTRWIMGLGPVSEWRQFVLLSCNQNSGEQGGCWSEEKEDGWEGWSVGKIADEELKNLNSAAFCCTALLMEMHLLYISTEYSLWLSVSLAWSLLLDLFVNITPRTTTILILFLFQLYSSLHWDHFGDGLFFCSYCIQHRYRPNHIMVLPLLVPGSWFLIWSLLRHWKIEYYTTVAKMLWKQWRGIWYPKPAYALQKRCYKI